jgi:diguanylate cyclase (GGDEF)-like protein
VLGLYFGTSVELDRRSLATVVELLAAEAAVVLQRGELLERLEAMARTDDLTGLPNRRAWEDQLPREMARAQRDGRELSVAMLDLDRFKTYNDRFGHQAGDRLLKQAAGAWSGVLRTTDLLARYGGEEFALALSSGVPQADNDVIERLREVTPEGVTCSAGLVRWDGKESAEDLLGRADAALYSAKRAGRDRVVSL